MTENDKLIRLRKLHSTPARKAQIVSLSFKITGMLLLTAGLFLIMTDTTLQSETTAMAAGTACLLGWALVALGYPMYGWVILWQRRRITPEILQLTEELLM